MNTEDKYFFCYSTNLHEFLRYEKEIKYVCTAFHATSNKRFWLFERSEELKNALTEYRLKAQELGIKKDI